MLSGSGVYGIKNIATGKLYVGSAVVIKKRFATHRCELRRNKHHSSKLQRSWNKHGEESFEFIILEVVSDPSQLIAVEQKWIDYHHSVVNGYNVNPLARSCLGVKRSPEVCAKISEINIRISECPKIRAMRSERSKAYFSNPENRKSLGRSIKAAYDAYTPEQRERQNQIRMATMGRPEVRAKLSAIKMGTTASPETKEKLSAARRKQKQTPETRAKRSATLMGHPTSPETREKIRQANIGWRPNEQQRAKLVAALTGRKQSAATIAKRMATIRARRQQTIESRGQGVLL